MSSSALTAASEVSVLLSTVPVVGVELGQTAVTAVGILLILLLLMGSGFFSSSEIAMFSLSAYQIDAMVEEGKRGARAIKSLKADLHRLLVTILVGNNLVNITMSSISMTIVGFIFNRAGRLVEQGDEFEYENVTLRAEQVEDTRIQKARVTVDRDTVDAVDEESLAEGDTG